MSHLYQILWPCLIRTKFSLFSFVPNSVSPFLIGTKLCELVSFVPSTVTSCLIGNRSSDLLSRWHLIWLVLFFIATMSCDPVFRWYLGLWLFMSLLPISITSYLFGTRSRISCIIGIKPCDLLSHWYQILWPPVSLVSNPMTACLTGDTFCDILTRRYHVMWHLVSLIPNSVTSCLISTKFYDVLSQC